MTEILILSLSVIVWINRGLYDPFVLALTIFFLKWVWSVMRGGESRGATWSYSAGGVALTESKFWMALPWIWSILVIFRNDLLYVDASLSGALRVWSFLPLLIMTVYTLLKKHAPKLWWVSVGLWTAFFLSVLWLSPNPHIDVFQSNSLGADHLLHWANPYSSFYPDIYKSEFDYKAGFLYWPGALILETISRVLFHDIRVILVLAWMGSVVFLRERSRWIAIWCSLPFLGFAFEQAWLDPIIALCAVLVMFALERKKYWLWAVSVAVAASVKQYGALLGIFSLLWMVKNISKDVWMKWVGVAAGIFVVVMLPFILWGPHAFFDMTVTAHASAAVRLDALNFTAFWIKNAGLGFPGWLQAVFTLLGFSLAGVHVWKNQSNALRLIPEAWTIAFGFSIFFGKFAFCNYYLLLLGFLFLSRFYCQDHLRDDA